MRMISLFLLLTIPVWANSLVYEYKDGKCVDAQGNEGLNPLNLTSPCTDFRGIHLGYVNFENVDLRGSQFISTELQKVSFKNVNLEKVNFEGATLIGIQFSKTRIKETNFKSAILKQVVFSEEMYKANFDNVSIKEGNYSYLSCQECSFRNSDMNHAIFENVDLAGSDFSEAHLSSASFQNSNLSGTNLKNADLSFVIFQNTNLNSIKLMEADLSFANFLDSDISNANLVRAHLENTKFQDVIFKNANFKDAVFNRRTLLPFSFEEAEKYGLLLYQFEALTRMNDHTFYKVRVEGPMTDANVFATCEAEGFQTPCLNEQNGYYSDEKCVDVGWRDYNTPMRTVSHKLCGDDKDPHQCLALNNVFSYMGEGFYPDYISSCGVVDGNHCAHGQDYSYKFALCVK